MLGGARVRHSSQHSQRLGDSPLSWQGGPKMAVLGMHASLDPAATAQNRRDHRDRQEARSAAYT